MKQFLSELARAVDAQPSLPQALELARHYGSLCWSMGSVVYDSFELERKLAGRFAEEYRFAPATVPPMKDTLHVASELYLTGGHTRLMEKLAGMHECPPDLMITRPTPTDVIHKVAEHFACLHDVSDQPSDIERICHMIKLMVDYKRVVLSIHPDDIAAVVACLLAKTVSDVTIYLVNHADHTFSFGSAAADFYFELSSYGRRVDGLKTISGRKSFLGIPVNGRPVNVRQLPSTAANQNELVFFSAGSDVKFKPREGVDIRPLITALLQRHPSATFVVVGPNVWRDTWWWRMKLCFGARLKLLKIMPYEDYLALIRDASFFVDSHPMPGGTAFAEQLLAGRRCIGLVSPYQGYSPAEKMKSADVDTVCDRVINYHLPPGIVAEVLEVNGYEAVKERYLGCIYGGHSYPNLLDSLCAWTGDVQFFSHDAGRGNVDVSALAFSGVLRLEPVLALKVFAKLRPVKKMKLLIKLALVSAKRLASGIKG
ncbi:hypothetical protein [Pseudomonas sp. NPDC090592]|uniref:hypothetical protein n=1 Tax=Pseudomonas sp. NPDC090592 TaxID=3364480 RepID=UPI00383AFD8E